MQLLPGLRQFVCVQSYFGVQYRRARFPGNVPWLRGLYGCVPDPCHYRGQSRAGRGVMGPDRVSWFSDGAVAHWRGHEPAADPTGPGRVDAGGGVPRWRRCVDGRTAGGQLSSGQRGDRQ